jgi:hypothetical protein
MLKNVSRTPYTFIESSQIKILNEIPYAIMNEEIKQEEPNLFSNI